MNTFRNQRNTLAISTFRQNQTVNVFLLMAYLSPLIFLLFSVNLNAENSNFFKEGNHTPLSLDLSNEEGPCDCTPNGDTEPPRIWLLDPLLDGLSHGDTLYVSCDQQMGFDLNSAKADDNCDLNPSLEFKDYAFNGGNCHEQGYLKEIICGWIAEDECGNKDSIVITFHVVDDIAPVFEDIQDTITVECDNINTFFPTATDNCDGRLFITRSDTIMPGDCPGQSMILRSWIVNDACGNESIEPQVLMVEDTKPPTFQNVPADLTLSCEQAVPGVANVTATDNCSSGIMVQLNIDTTGDACFLEMRRTWSAEDDCGNFAEVTQLITVIDTTAPAFLYQPSSEHTVECDQPTPNDNPVFRDNCDPDFAIAMTYDSTAFDCGWEVLKTWTATDQCGNSTFFSQTIFGVDRTPPTFNNTPRDTTVECDAIPAPAFVSASDNCDLDVSITLNADIISTLCNNQRMVRTWIAEDNCGNESFYTQTINIIDTTAPQLSGVPADVTIECTETPNDPVVTAFDNCDNNPDIILDVFVTSDDCFTYLERTWTATDDCGNSYSETQVVTITDFTNPVLDWTHPDLIGQSDGGIINYECTDVVQFSAADASATDNCDTDVTITYSESSSPSPDCNNDGYLLIITSVWTATDNCGNETTRSIRTQVIDTTNPELSGVPGDLTLGCQTQIPAPANVNATDNCDTGITAVLDERTEGTDCNERLIRTWTATDACGNSISETQIITLIDTLGPVAISVPQPITIECSDPIPTDQPTFQDECATNFVVTESSNPTPNSCGFFIERTWTATDDCGNQTIVSQLITGVDTTPPTFVDLPADVTAACDAIPTPPTVTATDNCDLNVDVTFSEDTFGAGNCGNWEIVRTWIATDNCGNETIGQQVISISDDTPPVFLNMDPDITIECDETIPGSNDPDVTDNCDNDVTITVNDVRVDGNCVGNFTIERIWTATDDCGNSTTAIQNITAVDNTPPVITFVHPFLVGHNDGDTIVIQCDNLVLLDDEDATASDNCSIPTIEFDEMVVASGNCATDGFFERLVCTWTATDDCGNQSTSSVVVEVKDDTAPVFTNVPPSTDLACEAGGPMNMEPTVTDNCDPNVTFTLDEQQLPGNCAGGFDILKTWTATDFCGNTSTATQMISFSDGTAPVIIFNDPNLTGVMNGDVVTFDCDNLITLDENSVTVTDVCDDSPDVTFDEIITTDLDCASLGYFTELICTWTATDDCGNVSTMQITVRLTDTTPPTISGAPADITVDCGEVIPAPTTLTAIDNCDNMVDITMSVDSTGGRCPGASIITRTWTATDDCGNTATVAQVITQEDATPPVVTIAEPLLNVSCTDVPPIPTPMIVDNCGQNPLIGYAENRIDGACPQSYTIERVWTATDGCGNSSTGVQTINVSDTEAPVLNNPPVDMAVSCDQVPPVQTNLQPADNCDFAPMVTFAERQTGTSCADFVLIREWTVSDACGNSNVYTQNISLTDDTPPVFSNVPADGTFECDNIPDPMGVVLTDDCDMDPTMTLNETRVDGSCSGEYQLTRTWTGTDRCGNRSTATQVLNIVDNTAPVISLFVSPIGDIFNGMTVEFDCSMLVTLDENSVTVTDCDANPDIEFIEDITVSNDCEADGYLTRMVCTWIATDDCGNESQLSITVNIVDTQGPTFVNPPVNDTLYLSQGDTLYPAQMITAVDDCGTVGAPTFVETTNVLNDCSSEVIRIWTVRDGCGNVAAHMQTIVMTSNIEVNDVVTRQPDCAMSNGIITFFVSGNPSDYVYNWSPNIGTPNGAGNERSGLPEGEYIIKMYASGNQTCEQTFIIQLVDDCITDPDPNRLPPCDNPANVFSGDLINASAKNCNALQPLCLNIEEDEIAVYAFYVNGQPYDESFIDCAVDGQIALSLPVGINEVIAVDRAEGCTQTTAANYYCIETSHINKTITYQGEGTACIDFSELPGDITTVTSIEDANTDECVTFELNREEDCINFTGNDIGTSMICVVACDDMGLCDTTFLTVNVRIDENGNRPELHVHSGFSPNADGINDVFKIDNIQHHPRVELQVYNRWGVRVLKEKSYKNDWAATWEGGDLPDGTYFYLLKNEGKTVKSGYVQILR